MRVCVREPRALVAEGIFWKDFWHGCSVNKMNGGYTCSVFFVTRSCLVRVCMFRAPFAPVWSDLIVGPASAVAEERVHVHVTVRRRKQKRRSFVIARHA